MIPIRIRRLILACLCMLLLFSLGAQPPDQTPQALIRQFYATYEKRDVAGNMALWSPQSAERGEAQKNLEMLLAEVEVSVVKLETSHLHLKGDQGRITAALQLEETDKKTGRRQLQPLAVEFHLARLGGVWKVERIKERSRALIDGLRLAETDAQRDAILEDSGLLLKEMLMQTLMNLGDRVRIQQNSPVSGLPYYQSALYIAEQLKSVSGIASARGNIGTVYSDLQQYPAALREFEASRELFTKLDHKLGLALLTGSMGVVHLHTGEYDLALPLLLESLRRHEAMKLLGQGDPEGVARECSNLGILYAYQRNFELARFYLERARTLRENSPNRVSRARVYGNLASVYAHLAADCASMERLEDAEKYYAEEVKYYEKALQIFEQDNNRQEQAAALHNMGYAHLHFKIDLKKAADYTTRALTLAEETKFVSQIARSRMQLARIAIERREFTDALNQCDQALPLITQVGDGGMDWLTTFFRGKALQGLKRNREARAAYDQAIHKVKELRARFSGSAATIQLYLEDKVEPYHVVMQMLLDEQQTEQALVMAEQAKSRALLDVLQSEEKRSSKGMNPEEKKQEETLRAALVSANAQAGREPGKKTEEQAGARRKYETFLTEMYAKYPDLGARRGNFKPITPQEWQGLVSDEKTALLSYTVTEARTHLFVLTRKQGRVAAQHYAIPLSKAQLTTKVNAYRGLLDGRMRGFVPIAMELYQKLIYPARSDLKGKEHLVIFPDEILWNLPFQALKPSQSRYLIQDADILYAPSLTAWKAMRGLPHVPHDPSRLLLALGNPRLEGAIPQPAGVLVAGERPKPLPDFAQQVNRLRGRYGAARCLVLTGEKATEAEFKANAAKYPILHLGMHGYVNQDSPLYSFLAFATPQPGAPEDGLLEAWELLDLTLNADLVILSACKSAAGRIGTGEGLVGLTWGLFVAGSRATIASHWDAQTDSTVKLLDSFYTHWLPVKPNAPHPMSRAQALQKAQIELIEHITLNHPYNWATFSLIGDGR